MEGFRKLMIIKRSQMSSSGIRHWSPKLRSKVHKYTYSCLGAKYIPLDMANKRMDFARWLHQEFGIGYFFVYSWRMKRPKKGGKRKPTPYCIAIVNIIETKDSYVPEFVDISRIKRERWFEAEA